MVFISINLIRALIVKPAWVLGVSRLRLRSTGPKAEINWTLRLRENSRKLSQFTRSILASIIKLYSEGLLSREEFEGVVRMLGIPLYSQDNPARYEEVTEEEPALEEPVDDDECVNDDVERVEEEYVGWRFVRGLMSYD